MLPGKDNLKVSQNGFKTVSNESLFILYPSILRHPLRMSIATSVLTLDRDICKLHRHPSKL